VYFQSAKAVRMLVDAFKHSAADYVPSTFFNRSSSEFGKHWVHYFRMAGFFPEVDWSGSFAPVMRVSRNLVETVFSLKKLELFEVLLPTLAVHHTMQVVPLREFGKYIRWRPCWRMQEITKKKDREVSLFHPVKEKNGVFTYCDCWRNSPNCKTQAALDSRP